MKNCVTESMGVQELLKGRNVLDMVFAWMASALAMLDGAALPALCVCVLRAAQEMASVSLKNTDASVILGTQVRAKGYLVCVVCIGMFLFRN